MDTGKSALGLDGNVAAALGYPIGIIAIISLIMEKENRFVKFHALQAILIFAAYIVIWVAVIVISIILAAIGIAASAAGGEAGGAIGSIIGLLWWLVVVVILIALLIGLIMAAVKAYQGQMYRLPIIGNLAAKWAGV
ncbi:MAG: hypothetical protein WAM70_19515 [Pyrinomonadaceae bacterium]